MDRTNSGRGSVEGFCEVGDEHDITSRGKQLPELGILLLHYKCTFSYRMI